MVVDSAPKRLKVVCCVAAVIAAVSAFEGHAWVDGRAGNRPRTRMDWPQRVESLSDGEFKKRSVFPRLPSKGFRGRSTPWSCRGELIFFDENRWRNHRPAEGA